MQYPQRIHVLNWLQPCVFWPKNCFLWPHVAIDRKWTCCLLFYKNYYFLYYYFKLTIIMWTFSEIFKCVYKLVRSNLYKKIYNFSHSNATRFDKKFKSWGNIYDSWGSPYTVVHLCRMWIFRRSFYI